MPRNGFVRKKVDLLALGEKLKKIRSDRRISLNDVSKNTKIQVKYLEYLENGEYGKLPPDVYVKGFIRSYAGYLGLNENALFRLYEREKGIEKNIKKIKDKNSARESINFSGLVITPKHIAVAAAIILAISGLAYFYGELKSFVAVPRLLIYSPLDGSVIGGNPVQIAGRTEKGAQVFINDQKVNVGENGEFSENVILQSGLNSITVRAVNKFEKETAQIIKVQTNLNDSGGINQEEEMKNEKSAAAEKEGREEMELEIYAKSNLAWISIEIDGNLVYSGALDPEAAKIFKAREKITVSSERGNDTFIKINGQEKGSLSQNPGLIKNVVFTKNKNP